MRREAPEGATFYLAIGDGWVAARASSEQQMCRWFQQLSCMWELRQEAHLEWIAEQRRPFQLQTQAWWLEGEYA